MLFTDHDPIVSQANGDIRADRYSAGVLKGEPNASFSETVWSTTAIRLQGGRYNNPEVRILVRLEPCAQDAVLARGTPLGSIPPCGGSLDRGTGFITAALDAGVPLRDVQEAASHADPRTTMRYDRARTSLDRHATCIVAAFIAGAAR